MILGPPRAATGGNEQMRAAVEGARRVCTQWLAVHVRRSDKLVQCPQNAIAHAALVDEIAGLTLLEADNKTGYFGVYHKPGRSKPYEAQVWRGGTTLHLGRFSTPDGSCPRASRK